MGCIVTLTVYWGLGNTVQYQSALYWVIQYLPAHNTIILLGYYIANIRIVYIISNTGFLLYRIQSCYQASAYFAQPLTSIPPWRLHIILDRL